MSMSARNSLLIVETWKICVIASAELQRRRLSSLFLADHALFTTHQLVFDNLSSLDSAKLPLSSLFPPSINEVHYPNLTEFHISEITDTPREMQKMLASLPVTTKSVFISSTRYFWNSKNRRVFYGGGGQGGDEEERGDPPAFGHFVGE